MLTLNDFASEHFFCDPYPVYKKLRNSGKPFWMSGSKGTVTKGMWLFGRYSEAVQVFNMASGISKSISSVRHPGVGSDFDLNMLHRDGMDHLRLRRLVSEYFSVRSIAQLTSVIEGAVDQVCQHLSMNEGIDLIADFSEKIPLAIFADFIGIPESDMAKVRGWSLILGDSFDSFLDDSLSFERQKQARQEFEDYVAELIRVKTAAPDESLLSYLVEALASAQLSRRELSGMLMFLLFAGHETTVNLIGNGLFCLFSNPEQFALLKSDLALVPSLVEEVLRYESPEQRTSFRLATEEVRIGDTIVAPGEQIGVVIGSANRDPEFFENPDVFDIRRTPNRHLAFGVGAHNCLGKTLARTEAKVAFSKFVEHFTDLALVDDLPKWRKNSFFRGLVELQAVRK